MASRDVNFIIKAKDEASRAFQSIAAELDAFIGKQSGAATAGKELGGSIAELVAQMAQFEKASGLVTQASDRAEASIERQRKTVSDTAAELEYVTRQIANAQRAIQVLPEQIVSVGAAGGDTTKLAAGLNNIKAELESLQGQEGKLTRQLAAQQEELGRQENSFRELALMANSAESAVKSFGDESERAALQSKASAEAANKEAEAIDAAQRMARARAAFNAGNRRPTSDGTTVDDGNSPPKASNTLLADQLRQEEAAHTATSAAITQEIKAQDALARSTQNLLDRTNPAAAIQRRLAEDIALARQAAAQGIITNEKLAQTEVELARQAKAAQEALQNSGSNAKLGLFGLKPYELTNLGYQINDVISGFAMGQRPMQILAQQGGQILQLMPKVGGAIAGAFQNKYFLGAAAIFTAIAVSVKAFADEAETVRMFTAELGAMGEAGNATGESLGAVVKSLDRYSISTADAIKITQTFLRDGLNPDRFVEFGQTAKDMSRVLGIDVPTAAKMLSDALHGGFESILKLNEATGGVFTTNQLKLIKSLFDGGKAADAQSLAFKILEEKMRTGASTISGPYTRALDSFGNAWDRLKQLVSDSAFIENAAKGLGTLADKAAEFFGWLNGDKTSTGAGSGNPAVTAVTNQVDTLRGQLAAAKQELQDLQKGPVSANMKPVTDFAIQQKQKQIADLERQIASAGTGPTARKDSPEQQQEALAVQEMNSERELQRLREQGANAVEALRVRNENYLTAAEQRRRIALAGELAATKQIGDARKAAARSAAEDDERQKIQREKDAYTAAGQSPAMQAREFVIGREGFRATAKWDRNAYRLGYGSDTLTDASGNVSKVTSSSTVDLAGAIRDLDRRIKEFQDAIKLQIGPERFNSFNSQQQAVLTSVAYNYGTLGRSKDGKHGAGILDVVRTGTQQQIADAIRGLQNDNGGINRSRRNLEADTFNAGGDNPEIAASNQKQGETAEQRQGALNTQIEETNRLRKLETDELNAQAKLQDEALIKQQITAAGDKAVADLEKSVAEKNANLKPYEQKLTLSKEQLDVTRQIAEEEERARQHAALAQAATARIERPVNDLTSERGALAGQVQALQSIGDTAGAEALKRQITGINDELVKAIDEAIAFFQALNPNTDPLHRTREQIDATIASLKTARVEAQHFSTDFQITAGELQNAFEGSFSDAFKTFAQSIANGENVFKSFGKAVLSFAATFIEKVADMGLQMLAFQTATKLGFGKFANGLNNFFGGGGGAEKTVGAASSLGGGLATSAAGTAQLDAAATALSTAAGTQSAAATGLTTAATTLQAAASQLLANATTAASMAAAGGGGGGIFGAILGVAKSFIPGAGLTADVANTIAEFPAIFHDGGIVGMGSSRRSVSPAWFQNAIRYHGGGIAGLKPDEMPAILQRGEEVITRNDRRHRNNGGTDGGGSGVHVSQVLAIGEDQIAAMFRNAAFGKAVITHIKSEKETVRQLLG